MDTRKTMETKHSIQLAEDTAMFCRLRNLLREIEAVPDAHQRAIIMIAACIEEGMNEARRILPAMEALGFNRQHAAIILNREKGNDPGRHWWSRDSKGIYALHPERLAPAGDLPRSEGAIN